MNQVAEFQKMLGNLSGRHHSADDPETKLATLVPKHLLVDDATRFNAIFNHGVTFSSPWPLGNQSKAEVRSIFCIGSRFFVFCLHLTKDYDRIEKR